VSVILIAATLLAILIRTLRVMLRRSGAATTA
jgi:hypothetical protein